MCATGLGDQLGAAGEQRRCMRCGVGRGGRIDDGLAGQLCCAVPRVDHRLEHAPVLAAQRPEPSREVVHSVGDDTERLARGCPSTRSS